MARARRELQDQRFGRLYVMYLLPEKNCRGQLLWQCRCDCGNTKAVIPTNLRPDGRGTSSCGCLRREVSRFPNSQRGAAGAARKAAAR